MEGEVNLLTQVTTLPLPDGLDLPITGGDIDPCGTAVLLRSYNAIYELRPTEGGHFDTAFLNGFTRRPAPSQGVVATQEAQGEAITWMPGGGYLTASEGKSAWLHRVACQP